MSNAKDDIQVSVICMAYNQEKYIRQTLEGFVNQITNFKYEVLIHDDASTDHTADIILEYQQKYPNIIKPTIQTKNQYSQKIGIIKTFLFPNANGKYIAYCEGDDYWCDQTKLQRQYEALEQHPDCSLCVHKVKLIHEDGTDFGEFIPQSKYQIEDIDGVLSVNVAATAIWSNAYYPFQTSSYFIKRAILEERYKSDLNFSSFFTGDEVLLRIGMKLGNIYYIKDSMSCYRKDVPGSWIDRYHMLPYIEHVEHRAKEIAGDYYYDQYSDFQFHRYIQLCSIQRVLRIGMSWKPKAAKKLIRKYELDEKSVKNNISRKKYYAFCVLKYCRFLFFPIRVLWLIKNRSHTEVL